MKLILVGVILLTLLLLSCPVHSGELTKDIALMSLAGAADELSTHYALSTCTGCRELGPTQPIRLAGKAAVITLASLGAEHARRSGHKGWAKVIRWAPVLLWSGVTVNNLLRARAKP